MTKEDFCECMELIKNQYDKCEKINDGIYNLFGGGDKVWNTLNVNTEIAILTKAMGDTEEWIEYYIYDCKWGEEDNNVSIDGKVVPFRTYEDLYELIRREKSDKN